MLAVMDEAVTEDAGGTYYVLGAAVVMADPESARAAFMGVLQAGRSTPFHWHGEGVQARKRMIQALADVGALAHICIHHPTHPKRHEDARRKGIERLVPRLMHEGVDHLLIERREQTQDTKDRAALLDTFRELGLHPPPFTYDWKGKEMAELWGADAVCGAAREMVVGNPRYFTAMQEAGIIAELHYIGGTSP